MNMRVRPLTSILLVTVASSCLLSACSRSDFASKISGSEGRKEQMVDLNRRHPMLNPCFPTGPGAETAPPCIDALQNAAPPVAAPKANPPAPAPQATAFDAYDASGNLTSNNREFAPIQRPDADSEGEVDSSFFDRFFTARPDEKKPPTVFQQQPQSAPVKAPIPVKKDVVRKPLAENRYFDDMPLADAPALAAPQPVPPAPAASAQIQAPLVDIQPAPPAAAPIEMPQPDNASVPEFKPVKIVPIPANESRQEPNNTDGHSYAANDNAPARPSFFSRLVAPITKGGDTPEKTHDEPYPELSSVPPSPQRFNDVKAQKNQAVMELQADHAAAQGDRQMLAAEPSQTVPQPITPPPAANPPSLMGEVFEPKEPAPQLAAPSPAPVEFVQQPDDADIELAQPQPAPRKSWWQRFTTAPDSAAEPAAPPVATHAEPQPIQPLVAEPQLSVPATVPPESATDSATANGLPSPDKLQGTTALPPAPSQKSARERQYYLVP